MISIRVSGSGLDGLAATIQRRATELVSTKVQSTVLYIDTALLLRTPVWSGEAIRNMVWKVDDDSVSSLPALPEPDHKGHTSQMAIGEEPRRSANQQSAEEAFAQLDFSSPWHRYVLANGASDIALIEDGSSGLPGESRAPSGVFAITMAEVKARLAAGAM